MKLSGTSHVLEGNGANYTITNTDGVLTIYYTVYTVSNDIATEYKIETLVSPAGGESSFILEEGNFYRLNIYKPQDKSTFEEIYYIRYFDTLKANILSTIRDIIKRKKWKHI